MAKRKALPAPGGAQQLAQQFQMTEIAAVNPNNVQPVYSNSVGTMVSIFDVRLLFNEIVPESQNQAPKAVLKASVVLTPAHAKALYKALGETVEQYEKAFGEIQWPPKSESTKAN